MMILLIQEPGRDDQVVQFKLLPKKKKAGNGASCLF